MVGEDGFEPSKSLTTDLQSAPFGHSGTLPYSIGAGRRTRTPDLLITNQLLYRLSYTSGSFFRSALQYYHLYLCLSIGFRRSFQRFCIYMPDFRSSPLKTVQGDGTPSPCRLCFLMNDQLLGFVRSSPKNCSLSLPSEPSAFSS